jgi:hypothetical protein
MCCCSLPECRAHYTFTVSTSRLIGTKLRAAKIINNDWLAGLLLILSYCRGKEQLRMQLTFSCSSTNMFWLPSSPLVYSKKLACSSMHHCVIDTVLVLVCSHVFSHWTEMHSTSNHYLILVVRRSLHRSLYINNSGSYKQKYPSCNSTGFLWTVQDFCKQWYPIRNSNWPL